ncbi:hypothetical protein BC830DRAFT_1109358 [Chytriomyces sp. MP71]|nr:hypothetical protein BC830DRAFT_1109358 [Chytriomyces sp. MP71]
MTAGVGSVPSSVRLNCRQAVIHRIAVNGETAVFTYVDGIPESNARLLEGKTPNHHPDLRALYTKSLDDGEEGELVINLPDTVRNQLRPVDASVPPISSMSPLPLEAKPNQTDSTAFTSFTIHIEYELIDPKLGMHFVFPDPGVSTTKTPYLYTSNLMKSARFWTPCMDCPQQKTFFTLEVITPTTFNSDDAPHAHNEFHHHRRKRRNKGPQQIVAVSNGALVGSYAVDGAPGWKVTKYSFDGSLPASSVLIAVGVFGYMGFGDSSLASAPTVPQAASNIASAEGPVVAEGPTNDTANASKSADIAQVPDKDDEDEDDEDDEEEKEKKEGDDLDADVRKLGDMEKAASQPVVATGSGNSNGLATPKCEAFFHNGIQVEVQSTVEFLPQAMEFYEQFTGLSYPFPSFKMIFVEDLIKPIIIGAGMGIFSTHLLLDEDDIENVYDSRMRFSVALSSQWFGQYVSHRNWTDAWLTVGLANYMAGLFIRKLLGNNEYRFRLGEDMKRVTAMDVGHLPLCPAYLLNEGVSLDPILGQDLLTTKYYFPEDEPASLRSEFMALKAPLVIGMLDQRLGKGNLLKAINKVMISTMSGELENGLSTGHWFKVCRKISTFNPKDFADQWIFGSGCPKFKLGYKFSRKKLVVEVTIIQENTNKNHPTATKKFTGLFVVRVHEPKGTAYSHEIMLDEMEKVVELPYNTKYKRAGQKLKKLQKLGFNAGGPENVNEGDEEYPAEFTSQPPQSEEKQKAKPDLDEFDRRSLDWIRWDPDMDWLCVKVYDQLQSMWVEQLARDLDVVAQHEAVVRLGYPCQHGDMAVATAAISRLLLDDRHFYRLRMEASFSLARQSGADGAIGAGLNKLIAYFTDKYCYPKAFNSTMVIPRPNDFSNFQEYFVKKALCAAIVTYRDAEMKIPLHNKMMILDLLRFNDNSKNEYSDGYYIAVLINSLCHATIPQKARTHQPKQRDRAAAYEGVVEVFDSIETSADMPLHDDSEFGSDQDKAVFLNAHAEVERYLALDRLMASHQNVVTRACLEAILKWMLAGMLPLNLSTFLRYSSYGNYFTIRMVAIDALLLLDSLQTPDILEYLLMLIDRDPDSKISLYTAKELYNLVALTKSIHDCDRASDGKRPRQSSWALMRPRITQNQVFGERLWKVLTCASLDPRLKAYMLRFAEVVYKPVPSTMSAPPKKFVIKMPSLSISESADFGPPLAGPEPKSSSKSSQKSNSQKPSVVKQPTFIEPFPTIDPKFLKTGQNVIKNLQGHPSSAAFQLPVDESFAPLYFSLIKKPMDISTCYKKLESGAYRNNLDLLFNDVQLIFSNCYKYNTDDSPVSKQAQKLERYFNTEIMPRAVVHELELLSTAVDVVDDPIPITSVEPAPAPLPTRPIIIPLPPKPIPLPPKPLMLPTKSSTTTTSQTSSQSKPATQQQTKSSASTSKHPVPSSSAPPKPFTALSIPKPATTTEDAKPSTVVAAVKPAPAPPSTKPVLAPLGTRHIPAPAGTRPVPAPLGTRPVPAPLGNKPIPTSKSSQDIPRPGSSSGSPNLAAPKGSVSPIVKPTSAPAGAKAVPGPAGIPKSAPKPILKLKAEDYTATTSPQSSQTAAGTKRKLSNGSPSVLQGESTRMPSDEYKKCKKIIRRLFEDTKSHWFQLPLDPIALGIPTYFSVIKEPMDLSTLKTKLSAGELATPREFRSMAALIFKNAITFNQAITQVHQDALFMLTLLKTEFRQMFGDSSSSISSLVPQKEKEREKDSGDPEPLITQSEPIVAKKLKLKHEGVSSAIGSSSSGALPSSGSRMRVTSSAGKKCAKILRKLQNDKHGTIFAEPVDPVKLNIPTYFSIIKHPMDLRTIQRKLESNLYRDHNEFRSDVELMLNNCFTFNVPGDWVYMQGKGLETVFQAEWRPIDWNNIASGGKPIRQTIEEALAKLRNHPDALIFLEPVDPGVLPDYHSKIKHPIDFMTMGQKLDRGEYQTLDDFERDFKLLLSNCFTYNPKKSFGHMAGERIERYFKSFWRKS